MGGRANAASCSAGPGGTAQASEALRDAAECSLRSVLFGENVSAAPSPSSESALTFSSRLSSTQLLVKAEFFRRRGAFPRFSSVSVRTPRCQPAPPTLLLSAQTSSFRRTRPRPDRDRWRRNGRRANAAGGPALKVLEGHWLCFQTLLY